MRTRSFAFSVPELKMIILAAAGYFVDIYDLLIFSSERVESLQDIGVTKTEMKNVALMLQNYQMAGLVAGGFLFGILADKHGRLKVLFASILLYSFANLGNAFVTSVPSFAVFRFVAGLGLAGELGIALSWISESLRRNQRTIATIIVSAVGLCGGIAAAMVSSVFHWQTSYIIGGVMGLLLLGFRITVQESDLYNKTRSKHLQYGNLLQLFGSRSQLAKFSLCVLSGAPAFIFMSLYVTLAPEFAAAFNITGKISVSHAVMVYLIAFTVSDILCGILSKVLQTRKNALLIYVVIQAFAVGFFFLVPPVTSNDLYMRCIFLGFSVGYWGILITNSLEQFGTNIRATVATSTSNLIRGITIPATLVFSLVATSLGIIASGMIIGFSLIGISIISIMMLKDKFENDLNFVEVTANN